MMPTGTIARSKMTSTFDKAKDSALEVGLTEDEAVAYATDFIKVLGIQEATERLSCACGCDRG